LGVSSFVVVQKEIESHEGNLGAAEAAEFRLAGDRGFKGGVEEAALAAHCRA
jgi:hypothetical protein